MNDDDLGVVFTLHDLERLWREMKYLGVPDECRQLRNLHALITEYLGKEHPTC